LVIFVSERVLADEFAFASVEVPASAKKEQKSVESVTVDDAIYTILYTVPRTHHTLPSNIFVLRRRKPKKRGSEAKLC